MSKDVLKGQEPAAVLRYFEEICGIPHGSGNIGAISDYLVAFAVKQGLNYVQEPCGNVIIYADATPGYENEPAVILQGHMDMVAVKDADCPIDMEKEGLSLFLKDGQVGAFGTSLGGDDGIAIAYALAILSDPGISHPRLEFLATVNEETGMDGAIALDPSHLTARRLINLDSEDEGILIAGCAGGLTLRLRIPLDREESTADGLFEITVEGLLGGHSGTEIDKNRANAILLLARTVAELKNTERLRLISISGGTKDNVIPNRATALVAASRKPDVSTISKMLRGAYSGKEDGLTITVKEADLAEGPALKPLTAETERKLLTLLQVLPFGPLTMSTLPGLVETSDNVGIIRTTEEQAEIAVSVRSLIESEKEALCTRISLLAGLCGAKVSRNSEYPGWQYRLDSPIREKAVAAYREQYGEEPRVETIHAGLECGLLIGKMPDLDAISLGPDIKGAHTTSERLDLASTARTWEILLRILAKRD